MNQSSKINVFDFVNLLIIGTLSIFYSTKYSNFAKLHINLPFLNFPIFIGELVLLLCIAVLIVKWKFYPVKFTRWSCLLFIFIFFILIKSSGYFKWGPLALRNAALFYYSLFAVVGYYSFNIKVFKNKFIRHVLFYLITGLFLVWPTFEYYILKLPRDFFRFNYYILLIIFCLLIKNKIIKYFILGLILLLFPFKIIALASRGSLICIFISLLFFFIIFVFFYFRKHLKLKIVFIFFFLISLLFLNWHFGNKANIMTLFAFKSYYKEALKDIDTKNFKFKDIPVKLYEQPLKLSLADENKKTDSRIISRQPPTQIASSKYSSSEVLIAKKPLSSDKSLESAPQEVLPRQPSSSKVAVEPAPTQELSLADIRKTEEFIVAHQNVLWRIFVLKDMLEEWWYGNSIQKIFGIDFGKPFRSKTLEFRGSTSGSWVGWLEPHNSYVHILYRSGIVGAFYIIAIFVIFLKITITFVKSHNIKGLLLSTILLFWLILINLNVILELPYLAIPFWSLFGMVLKYCNLTYLRKDDFPH